MKERAAAIFHYFFLIFDFIHQLWDTKNESKHYPEQASQKKSRKSNLKIFQTSLWFGE